MRIRIMLVTLAVLFLLPVGVAAEEAFNYNYFDLTYLDNGMDSTATTDDGRDRIAVNIGEGDGMGIRLSLALDRNIHVFAGYSGSNMDLNATHTAPYPTLDEMAAAFFTTPAAASWDGQCDLDGDGSVNFADLAILRAADSDTRVSLASVGGDLTDWKVGIGYNTMLAPKVGVYAQLFWDARDIDFGTATLMGLTRDFSANDSGAGAAIGLRAKVSKRLELTGRLAYSPVGDINMLAETKADMLDNDTLFGIGSEFWFSDFFSVFAEVENGSAYNSWIVGARYAFRS